MRVLTTGLLVASFTVLAGVSARAQMPQQGPKLVGSGAEGNCSQGWSVAASLDGSTMIVGAFGDNGGTGAAWIFTRDGGTWSQQGSKLVGTGAIGEAHQGSVSISGDGNTAIVGGLADDSYAGAAWVFTRSGGEWSQQGSKLVGSGAVGPAQQGSSVSISADGNTAIMGGPADSFRAGAVWIFTRSGGVWSQQGSKLVGEGAVAGSVLGASVSISGDGRTAVAGGNGGVGAAWIFTQGGGVWSQQGSKLVGTGAAGSAQQGGSVSLSADGNAAIVGGDGDNGGLGAAWIFTRSGGVWNQQGSKLIGTGGGGSAAQGSSVSISGDGSTAVVGGFGDDGRAGAVWVFTASGGVWIQRGGKLVGSGASAPAWQGNSVSLSGDGGTMVVGGPGDDGASGAAWVFTEALGVWSQQGGKLVGTGAVGSASLGSSASISADGGTAIVGGSSDHGNAGAAWVFTRIGGVWSQQGGKLVGTGAAGSAQQGTSVAISADGKTAIVGGPMNGGVGAAWIFTRMGGVWSQQGDKLSGTASFHSYFGFSVSISGDGNTAIVGGLSDGGGVGAAWIFTRSGGVWTQEGSKLVGPGLPGTFFGGAVSISADGNTAIVGGVGDNGFAGAVWIFVRSGGTWSQQGDKLTGPGMPGAYLGSSVSLSGDGNVAIVGSPGEELPGGAWIFARSGEAWRQEGTRLIPAGGSLAEGSTVSISGDGNTAIVGGLRDNGHAAAAWTFTRSAGVWSQPGSILVGMGATGAANRGQSVAISGDGRTVIVGGAGDHTSLGAAWVFSSSPTQMAFVQQPTPTVAGGVIVPAVGVQLEDIEGNPTAVAEVAVSLSLSSGTGTLSGTVTSVTNAAGLATFADLSINLSGSKQLAATSPGLTPAVSTSFPITAGAPASIVVAGGTPQSAPLNTTFPDPLQVTVTDAFGNPVSGAAVTFVSPTGAAGAVLGKGGIATTDVNGRASVTATANLYVGGPYIVTATVGALPAARFSLTNLLGTAEAIPGLDITGLIGFVLALAAGSLLVMRGALKS